MTRDSVRAFLRVRNRQIRALARNPRLRFHAGLGTLVIVVTTLTIIGASWLHQRLTHVSENDARVEAEVATIASRFDGWLLSRPVMEGDHVSKGQVLAELDARDARLRLTSLEGNLAALDAQIQQTTIQRDTTQQTSEAQIKDARAQLTASEAALAVASHQTDLTRADFERADPLVKSGSISKQSWDHTHVALLQAEATLRQNQAQVESHRATLAQANAQRAQVDMLSQQIKMLGGQREALAAQASQVRLEIQDRTLRAPFDGIIDRTFIHEGDYVQAGQWLMMMHDPGAVWVEANVKETAVGDVKVGQKVTVTVDAFPDLVVKGHVIRVGNAATNQFALLPSPNPSGNFTKITQRVPVRIALENLPHPLQPGLMVEVSINVAN
ncbi:MAG: HlyD family secretion protein [Alphaproteobacteria bacterium]|nr:HlyD family secretion protein [Alphaproteobacteria bacterium]